MKKLFVLAFAICAIICVSNPIEAQKATLCADDYGGSVWLAVPGGRIGDHQYNEDIYNSTGARIGVKIHCAYTITKICYVVAQDMRSIETDPWNQGVVNPSVPQEVITIQTGN